MKLDWSKVRKGSISIIALLSLSITANAQTGSIEGIAADKKNKEVLPGVTVIIEGTTIGASTDIEGHFIMQNVKPGKYRLKASYISYTPELY